MRGYRTGSSRLSVCSGLLVATRLTDNQMNQTNQTNQMNQTGLLMRHSAIDVPADSVAGFERVFVIPSKFSGFHEVEGKDEGTAQHPQDLS